MIRKVLALLVLPCLSGCYALNFEDNLIETYCTRVTACEADMLAFYVGAGYDEATAAATYEGTKDAYCNPEPSEDCGNFDTDNAKSCMADAEAQTCDKFAQGLTPDTCTHESICGP